MNKNYWAYWVSQLFTNLGEVLYQVVVMVIIYQKTQSSLQTALVLVASILPGFLISPWAGQFVDRHSRKKILLVSNIIAAMLIASYGLSLWAESTHRVFLYGTVILLSVVSAFIRPSKMALLPVLVREDQLPRANSYFIASTQGVLAIGFGMGGFLTTKVDPIWIILGNMSAFLIAWAILVIIPMREPSNTLESSNSHNNLLDFFQQLRQTYAHLKQNKLAYPLVMIEIIEHIPHGIWSSAITIAFIEKTLQGNMDDWGIVTAVYFSGMLLGAGIATIFSDFIAQNTGKVIIVNAILTTVNTLFFGLSPDLIFAFIVSFIFGIPNSIRDVAQDSLLQAKIELSHMGRVYAFKNMFTLLIFMTSGLVFASMTDLMDVRIVYYIGTGIYLITALIAAGNPYIQKSKIY